jgi:transcriptional regulator with XRE-family HTH domain
MSYMERKATYIRQWREAANGGVGYTLDEMVGRLAELGVPITAASLSRIERGLQPYSQDILEAIAAALGREPADLLENDPRVPEAEVVDLLRRLDDIQKAQASAVIKAMFQKQA